MIGPTAPDSAKITPNATGTMRPMIAQPATAPSPKRAISAVTKALPTGVAIWVITAGTPIAKNGRAAAFSRCQLGRAMR